MLIKIALTILVAAVLIGIQAYVHYKWPPDDSDIYPPGLF
jgi:predicted transporter